MGLWDKAKSAASSVSNTVSQGVSKVGDVVKNPTSIDSWKNAGSGYFDLAFKAPAKVGAMTSGAAISGNPMLYKDIAGKLGGGKDAGGPVNPYISGNVAETMYGQPFAQTGVDVQHIKKQMYDRTSPEYAKTQAAKKSQDAYRNVSQSLGRNVGAMQGAEAKRQMYNQQLARESQERVNSMNTYRDVISNILSGQSSMHLAEQGHQIAAQPVQAPSGIVSEIGDLLGF